MRFDATIDYPADVARVSRMLADEDFVRREIAASGALDSTIDIAHDGDAFTVTTRRKMPTDQVPSRFRSLVGASLDVRLVQAWEAAAPDGSRVGTISVDIVGAPVRVTGRMSLDPVGPGASRARLAGDITASIPLVGKPIERAAAGAVDDVVAIERRVAAEYLAEHPE